MGSPARDIVYEVIHAACALPVILVDGGGGHISRFPAACGDIYIYIYIIDLYIFNYIYNYILMNIYIYMDDVRWCEMMWDDLIFGCRCHDSPDCGQRYLPDPLGWNLSHQRLSRINVWPWPHSNWIRLWKNICKLSHNQLIVYIPIFDIVGNCFVTCFLACIVIFLVTLFPHVFFQNPIWWVLLLIFLFGWWFGTFLFFHKLGMIIPFD